MTTPIDDHDVTASLDQRELSLMRYFDGELDDEEARVLAGELAEDEEAKAKLMGFELVRNLLRDMADEDDRADGIADVVMGRLDDDEGEDGEREQEAKVVPLSVVSPAVVSPALQGPALRGKAANDNSRTIFALAAAAAAVAAGLFLWGRSHPADELATAPGPSKPPVVATSGARAGDAPKPAPETTAMAAAEAEPEQPVEIASVDFGAQQGSVFYVAGAKNAAAMSAVVWITEGAGEEE